MMQLVQVDVVGLQAFGAIVVLLNEGLARSALHVGIIFRHGGVHFGSQDDTVPPVRCVSGFAP